MDTANYLSNPWLGLKSYSEGKRLYGRDKEIEELSQKILYNTQTIIYGKSGIGKSSLLKAGVFPILRRNGYFPVYVRFVHENGQGSYTSQIITAVENALKHLKVEDLSAPEADVVKYIEGYKEEIVPIFGQNGEESMWEYFHRHKFFYKLNEEDEPHTIIPVLIFDQFEEIFTLQKDERIRKSFFDEFAGLLNNVCPKYLLQSTIEVGDMLPPSTNNSLIKRGVVKVGKRWDYIDETNLHIVLSLREDFLSYLERNIEHIPSLKHNRYCLLPLNEDQAAEVIMQPIPGLVSVEVAKEIICKVTGAKYDEFEIDDNPELEVDSAILSLFLSELYEKKRDISFISYELVEQFGSNIISDFYGKVMNNRSKISESSVIYLEKRLVTREERRDSIFDEQALRHGVTRDELDYLHECRLLHQYPWRDGTRIEFSHDVLCPIVMERRKTRDEILEKQKQQEAYLKLKRAKQRYMYISFFTILSVLLIGICVYDGWFHVKIERYAKIVNKYTWLKGADKLSEKEATFLGHHYVFYKTGRYAKYADSIEARNGYGELTSDHAMTTYLVNQFDDTDNKADKQMLENLKTVVKWVLVPNNTKEYCLQEKAYNKDGKLIYSFNNTITDNKSVFISTYVDEYGFPIVMRDSCYIHLRTTMNKDGYQVLREFFDDKGFPVMNKDGAFQTESSYFSNGIQKSEASRFLNGHLMIDYAENCGWEFLEMSEDGYNSSLSMYFDADKKPCRVSDGTMFKRWEYDDHGRVTQETYWKTNETSMNVDVFKFALDEGLIELLPDTNRYGAHGYIMEYNRYGQNSCNYAIDLNGVPMKASNRDFVKWYRQYDAKGNMVGEFTVDEDGNNNWEYFAEYTKDNELSFNKSYSLNEVGDTIFNYHLYWDNGRKIVKDYYDDYYSYYEYDSLGQLLLSARYKSDTGEADDNMYGLHKTVCDYQYDEGNKKLTITERYFDKHDNLCGRYGRGSYAKEITVVDSISHTRTVMRYTTNDILSEGVEYIEKDANLFYRGFEMSYNNNFEVSLSESSLDAYGMKHRTYENGTYYYQANYINSILPSHANESKGHFATNEFGEPSLIRNDGILYSAEYNGMKYDEYGHIISEEGLDRLMFAAIETDENIGFMDGDILIQQDDWVLWTSGSFADLDLEPKSDREHHFKVLRYNELSNNYDIVEIKTSVGDERVAQIEYKKFYVTRSEEKRVFGILREKIYPHMFELIPEEGGAIYELGLKTPALLVAVNDWDMTRHFGGERDSIINLIREQADVEKYVIVFDEVTEELRTFVVDSKTMGATVESYSVRPGYYEMILQKLKEQQKGMK